MRTDLESGAWIEHRPIQDLKGADKRALDKVGKPPIPEDLISDGGDVDIRALMAGLDVTGMAAAKRDAVWALIITGWSFDLPVPRLDKASGIVSDADAYGEIPIDDFEKVERILAPYEEKLGRRPNPKAPEAATTSNSNGSYPARAGGSRKG